MCIENLVGNFSSQVGKKDKKQKNGDPKKMKNGDEKWGQGNKNAKMGTVTISVC